MTSRTLRTALDELTTLAQGLSVDPGQARIEGEQLAAAVCEPSTGAYLDWAHELGREPSSQEFFAAASKGRRWRAGPTPLMSQLGNTSVEQAQQYLTALSAVVAAACTLGQPTPQVAGLAASATAAQQQALPGGNVPHDLTSLDAPGGLDPDLLTKLQTSQDRLKAMDEFTRVGNQAFESVLEQMRVNQARIDAMRTSPVVDSSGGGAPQAPGYAPVPGLPDPGADDASGQPQVAAASDDRPEHQTEEETAEPERSVDELLAELDELIGLKEVKAEIKRQAAILHVQALRAEAGLKVPTITRHLVFVGNPGTGKTTVARLVAGIYKAVGLLSKGQLIEVDRSELVAGYLGQTATKTAEVVASALGGVLFIDEAYSLSGDQYGEESINTLVKEMEDNRDDLVVIVAGYPAPMSTFIAENPGLASRFRTEIQFANYSDDELIQIFEQMVTNSDYDLAEGALDAFVFDLSRQVRDDTFGNGRYCRNVLEAAIGHQAWRLHTDASPSIEELRLLTRDDILGDAVLAPGDELVADADENRNQGNSQ
ncbi:AAA family ATPase [Propionimicrobium sp. PCR01-08-3]|uniref:AAA family ATPase n=1 Tax=Propionimicrobium sp. PCR01-08-3 TaxID=3052086 RepID=UPI00255CC194|nr:AAA family ATPase [Propionimicrobium sp. PCR01-08-3]WIY81976.1 AAA family ATPase [Propionimicrobium sp. PCR01-08-3]